MACDEFFKDSGAEDFGIDWLTGQYTYKREKLRRQLECLDAGCEKMVSGMKYRQNQMVDFILDMIETLHKDNDFDRTVALKVVGTGLKQKYPLTRYYIPKEL